MGQNVQMASSGETAKPPKAVGLRKVWWWQWNAQRNLVCIRRCFVYSHASATGMPTKKPRRYEGSVEPTSSSVQMSPVFSPATKRESGHAAMHEMTNMQRVVSKISSRSSAKALESPSTKACLFSGCKRAPYLQEIHCVPPQQTKMPVMRMANVWSCV